MEAAIQEMLKCGAKVKSRCGDTVWRMYSAAACYHQKASKPVLYLWLGVVDVGCILIIFVAEPNDVGPRPI